MNPVAQPHMAADPEPRYVEFAADQPEYQTLPALLFRDGKVLVEYALTEDERTALIRGERLRLWVWMLPQRCARCSTQVPTRLQPVSLEVTSEERA